MKLSNEILIEVITEMETKRVLEIKPKSRNKGFVRYRTELGCFEIRISDIESFIVIRERKI